ncbi:MAG: DUF115 domain-containing protein [Rickettsiales bacterium]|nr:DUF115 domain-containing protein [Rickettsiales bacterium]
MTPIRSRAKAELRSYKNLHKGKKVIIIGNGPSVRLEDLEQFKDYVTFSCNRFHLCYKDTGFRPTYTVCIDPNMIRDFGHDIAKNCENDLFISSSNITKNHDNAKYIYRHRTLPFVFSEDVAEYVSNGSSVVCVAMQIACYMGAKEIYLYGVDHSFEYSKGAALWDSKSVRGDNNHFIDNYRSNKKWRAPQTEEIEDSYQMCKAWLKEHDISIFNISRKTKLDIFPKLNIEKID